MAQCARRWDAQVETEAVQVLGARTMLGSCHGPTIKLRVDGATRFGPREVQHERLRLQAVTQSWVNDLAALLVHHDDFPCVGTGFLEASRVPGWMRAELCGGDG